MKTDDPAKIYLLPNLATAGNLICGFLAVLKIFEGTLQRESGIEHWPRTYESSLYFILLACIFDMLDGRLARLGGRESAFGREFDSIADIVSFGVAPALLIFKIVLYSLPNRIGWGVAVLYLVCGALRLARFNVYAALDSHSSSKEFTGFPIPAGAGLIASLTLVILNFYDNIPALEAGYAKYGLALLMIFLSFMMFSKYKYPSFKSINWRTQYSIPKFILAAGVLLLVFLQYKWTFAVIFMCYLLYGFFRPYLSKTWRREIEEELEDEEDDTPDPSHDSQSSTPPQP
jgi:CDP-diacylglycerol---serine O-phosphatidyltransferase